MLKNVYFTKLNPYSKHAEHDKNYSLDQLEENCTKMSRTRDTSLGDSNKFDYKFLAFFGGMFCIYFYVLSSLAQHCFTFLLTTFILSNATALQCQHYAYHLLHFLLAHFFTFASKLLYNKISQVTDRWFTKICSAAKNKYFWLSSVNFGNLYHLIRKCKIRQLLLWKGVQSEDKIPLISNQANKKRRKRELARWFGKKYFENLQLSAYKVIKRSRNFYHKLDEFDEFAINSKNVFNNTKASNIWIKGKFQILKVTELNYVEVTRTAIDETQPLIASPGSSKDIGSTVYISNNAGAYGKEDNNSKLPFKHIINSGFIKRIQPKNINVEAIKKSITAKLKNKRVLLKCSREARHGESVLSKEKRKFKWKKRHKDFIVLKMKAPKKAREPNEMKLPARMTSSHYSYEDVDELDGDSKWYKTQYEKSIGKPSEKGITHKNVLKRLKCQAKVFKILSPGGFGYRDQVKMKQKAVVLDWGKTPTAKLCTCPLTACTCEGNSLGPATDIPRGRLFSKYLPGVVVIRLLHDVSFGCADCVLRKCAPAPARTLSPLLDDAVSAKRQHYTQTGTANMPAEFCASGCKHFYLKTNKLDLDNFAGVVPSVGHRSKTENTTNTTEKSMSEDGLVEEEIEGAGDTPIYNKDDNIYARGFNLTTATQTEFDENGLLLSEETDRIKIPFTLRYTKTRDLRGMPMNIQHFDPCSLPHPTYELTFETMLHVRPELKEKVKKGIEVTLKTLSGTVSSYKRSWILGVEEMSERLSSYARGLQSRVRLGLEEDKVDNNMCDKDTCTYQRSEECLTKPNNERSDIFEKAKRYAQPTRGLSWPDIPKMRYDESIQTDNIFTPAKSENEVLTKLENYLSSLKMERYNEAWEEKSSMSTKGRPCGVKFLSDCSLTRTRNALDFFKTESIEKSDPQSNKRIVKCLCHQPKLPHEEENLKITASSEKRVKCHSKGAVNTTSAARIPSKRKVNLRFIPGTETNNIKQSLENETNEMNRQRESLLKAEPDNIVNLDRTTSEHIDKRLGDIAKNTPGSEKRVKCHCNDICNKAKSAVNTIPESAACIVNKREANLKVASGTETNSLKQSFKNETNENKRHRQSLKAAPDSIVKCDKTTCKHKGNSMVDIIKTTPGSEKNIKCHCNKTKSSVNTASDSVTGVADKQNKSHKAKSENLIDSKKCTSQKGQYENAKPINDKPANNSNIVEHNSNQISNETGGGKTHTPKDIAEVPLQGSTNNSPETNEKQTSREIVFKNKESIIKAASDNFEQCDNVICEQVGGKLEDCDNTSYVYIGNEMIDATKSTANGLKNCSKPSCKNICSKTERHVKTSSDAVACTAKSFYIGCCTPYGKSTVNNEKQTEDNVRTTHDVKKHNQYVRITNTEENNKIDQTNSSKTVQGKETLLLHKQSHLYFCLKRNIRTGGNIKKITDIKNDDKIDKLVIKPSHATKVRFESPDAKIIVKSKCGPVGTNLKRVSNEERGIVYYRCRRKSKAEVNSATTTNEIEENLLTEGQK